MYNSDEKILNIIFMTAQEFTIWLNVSFGNNVEIRESDYNRYKGYMREALNIYNVKADKYREIMETLFSKMQIENDVFFGKIYISTRYDFSNALKELVELEMKI